MTWLSLLGSFLGSFLHLRLLIRFADLLQLARVRFRVPRIPLQHLAQRNGSALDPIEPRQTLIEAKA